MTSLNPSAPAAVHAGVADLVRDLAAMPVSDDARATARLRLADTAFAALVGGRGHQGRRSAELAADLYGVRSVAGTAFRLVAACRMTEIDDVDLLSCVTPGSLVVPTVLAALVGTEADRWGGVGLDAVLDAIVRGYEVALGLGEAMRGPRRLPSGIWPSLAVGGVTAAAVTSWLLGAAGDEVSAAVVLASHQSLRDNPRGNARDTLLAGAVVAGIGCALAARRGFAIPGSRGGGVLADLLDTAPGFTSSARIYRPSVKSFCSARRAMTAVSALRAVLAAADLPATAIDRIDVEVPVEYTAMLDKPTVGSRRESLSSAQYQVALAALDPAGLLDVDRQTLRTPEPVRALMSVIHVHPADDLSARYPAQWPARVRVSAGTRTAQAVCYEVPGEREISAERLTAKIREFTRATPGLPSSTAELVERSVAAASHTDLRELAEFTEPAMTKEGPA